MPTSPPTARGPGPTKLPEDEDSVVTGVVAVLLAGIVLAYAFLCCHVWGLHLRLLQLVRRGAGGSDGRIIRSGSRALPASVAGVSQEEEEEDDARRPSWGPTPPPPRYSEVAADSLPSYSNAVKRTVLVDGGNVDAAVVELFGHGGAHLALTPLTLFPPRRNTPAAPATPALASVSIAVSTLPSTTPVSAAKSTSSPTPVPP